MIFNEYRKLVDILVIQETHSSVKSYELWRNEWGGDVIMSHGESNARGVSVFIKKNTNLIIQNIKCDLEGRYIIFDVEENTEKVTCVGLYAPNRDSPEFFRKLSEMLGKRNERKVILGDFNLVLDVELDRKNTYQNNSRAKEEVLNIMDQFSLVDIWRQRAGDKREFSWFKGTDKASRIDFALVSAGLDQKVENCMYLYAPKTDHRAMILVVDVNRIERGTGYWKLNVMLLTDIEYVNFMNCKISETLESSANLNAIEQWENLKKAIRKYSQGYSRQKAQESKIIESQLREKVNEFQLAFPLNQRENSIYEDTRLDLEEKLEQKAKGIMFRSKVKWYESGEKPTKYFFALEKAKYNAKTCFCIFDSEQKLIDDPNGILAVQREFYKDLYSEDKDVKFTLVNNSNIVVPKEIQRDQDRQITMGELQEAIKTMNNNKTPGQDGIPVDFYKVFWARLQGSFMAMMKQVYSENLLHESAREGILNLIPKANKDTRLVKNLRPITLLNTDYKIIEKAIANKMIPALNTIIHSDQRGFMKNRRISVNIRKLLDILQYAKENELEAVVLSLDFVKCFDKCSFDILHGSLNYFEFGEIVKDWTRILYKDFSVKIQNNGYFSSKIDIHKGVHQGGCCSSIYFLVIAEILAMALRGNDLIEGLTIYQVRNLLNQFADDADVFSVNSEESIKEIFRELERFRLQSGFTISYDKTVLYRIGSLRHSSAMLYAIDQVAWTNEDITVLGITVAHEGIVEKNYEGIVETVRARLNAWKYRGISLYAKIMIVNTLVMSLFVYKMMVLPKIPSKLVKAIEQEIKFFLWGKGKAKIAYRILQNPKELGGLNLTDLSIKDMSLKATWPQILSSEKEYARMVYPLVSATLGEDIWRVSIKPQDVESLSITSPFWKDVLISWATFSYWRNFRIENQMIWFNSRITIQNKPFLWVDAAKRGLKYVYQCYSHGTFKDQQTLFCEYGIDYIRYNSLKMAIPKEWVREFEELSLKAYLPVHPHNFDSLRDVKKLSSIVYKSLNGDVMRLHPKMVKWNLMLGTSWHLHEFGKIHLCLYKISNYTKLRDFQYRLLQRALVTNIQLKEWKIVDSNLCTFCHSSPETIDHLMYSCTQVFPLWMEFKKDSVEKYNKEVCISLETIVTNRFCRPLKHVINTIALLLKQYIYRQRCLQQRLDYSSFTRYVNSVQSIEKYIAIKNDKIEYHQRKWEGGVQQMNFVDIALEYLYEM